MVLQDATSPPPEPAYRIESVDKALRLLWLLREEPTVTVTQVGERLGVARSTAHRLLGMLQQHGFARQDPATKAYGAGRGLLEIGLAALGNLDVRRVARPEMEALAREVGETVQLILLEGRRTLVVDAVESSEVIRVTARTGGSMSPNCVSSGKVLLSQLPFERVRALIGPDPLEQRTPDSIGTLAELEPELDAVRARGYATNVDESEHGQTSISVPIPVPTGAIPAALTVSAPGVRMTPRKLPGVVAAAHAAAARIAEAARAAP